MAARPPRVGPEAHDGVVLGDHESDWEAAGWGRASPNEDDERPPPATAGAVAAGLLGLGAAGVVVVAFVSLVAVPLGIGAVLSPFVSESSTLPCDDPDLALWSAAADGDLDALAVELDATGDPDSVLRSRSPLLCAAIAGQVDAVDALIEAGADPDLAVDGTTALHQAVEGGHDDVIAALARGGADLEATNERGATALVLAARGRPQAVEALLDAGADPTTECDVDGMLVTFDLMLAAAISSDAVPTPDELPFDHRPLQRGRDSVTALHAAALGGDARSVLHLLQAGADPDAVAYGAFTPLHAAAARGALTTDDDHEQITALLLLAGADPTLTPDPTVGAPTDLS